MTRTYTVCVELEFEVTVRQVSRGRPGRTYGPPEYCYPPEAAEYEVESEISLTPAQVDRIREQALDEAAEDDWDPEDRADRAYDEWKDRRREERSTGLGLREGREEDI